MQFPEWAALWGPAFPIFLAGIWFLHRLVNKEVPRGFRDLRRLFVMMNKEANRRHGDHMDGMRELAKQMKKVKKRCGECGKPQRSKKKRTPTAR